ncbi:MAG: hypothetical protein U0353_27610 [Sandaracinus sp.]
MRPLERDSAIRPRLRASVCERVRLGPASVLIAALAMLAASPVRAQCEEPAWGPLEVTPALRAPAVTTDAWVLARFREGYFGPEGPGDDPATLVALHRCGVCGDPCDTGEPVPGHVQVLGDDLFFVPDAPLAPNAQYGGDVSGLETSLGIRFCTGSGPDTGPPTFGQAVRWSSEEVGESCELPDGGFRVGIFTQSASDDGPGGSLEYLLFLTRADGLEAPRLVDRVRNFAAGEITLRLFLDPQQAAHPVCVRLGVMDGVGNVTMGDSEQCFDPVTKVSFQGCAAGARGGVGSALVVALGLLGVLWRSRRSRSR